MSSVLGLSDEYYYKEISLDAKDFSSAQTSQYSALNWPSFNTGVSGDLKNIVGVKVISAQIPFSFYVFNSLNGSFQLREGGGPTTVSITPGNYNAAQICAELKRILDLGSIALGNANVYTVTYSSITNKISITASTLAYSFTMGTTTSTTNSDPHWFLGFNGGLVSSAVGAPFLLTSPNAVSLSGPNNLFVNSVRLGNLTDYVLPGGSVNLGGGNRSPQLTDIAIEVGPGSIITYTDKIADLFYAVDIDILQDLDLYFTLGNFGDVLDFNGLNFVVQIGFIIKKAASSSNSSSAVGVANGRVIKRSRPF